MGIFRLILALLVVNGHVEGAKFHTFIGGGEAVKVFFAISGFYMAMILDTKYRKTSDFYINRYLRLFPSYAIILLVSIA